MSREIRYIVVHCTGTPRDKTPGAARFIRHWRTVLRWRSPGYHYLIDGFGDLYPIISEEATTNGVAGHNAHSIHVAYVGGVETMIDTAGTDTRTPAQKETLYNLLLCLKNRYPKAEILGHRDFPGVRKACPSFDAKAEYKEIMQYVNPYPYETN